jgi:hypothetical protein
MPEENIVSLSAAIDALNDWLEEAGIPYTLIGGIAVSLRSHPRATQDVDAVIWLEHEKWPEALEAAATVYCRGSANRWSSRCGRGCFC